MSGPAETVGDHLTGGYDVILVGVGGQGVLTIGELIADAAMCQGMPVSFYPSKGMAQRGGFVRAQVRLGRSPVGPNIPERGADLAIAMEVSEALKAVRAIRPGGDFLLFAATWLPTAVMLGRAQYPSLDQACDVVQHAGARVHILAPESVPVFEGKRAPENVFVLGAAMALTGLGRVLDASEMRRTIERRWARWYRRNEFAFRAGFETG